MLVISFCSPRVTAAENMSLLLAQANTRFFPHALDTSVHNRSIGLSVWGIRRPRVAVDQRLEKYRSAGTGAAPVVAVQADAGVTVHAAVAALESGVCR